MKIDKWSFLRPRYRSSRASPLPHWTFSDHKCFVRKRSNVGAGLLAKAPEQAPLNLTPTDCATAAPPPPCSPAPPRSPAMREFSTHNPDSPTAAQPESASPLRSEE